MSCRFINQDPGRDGLNWYLRCKNNPLGYVDPNGEFAIPIITGTIVALVGGGYEAYRSWIEDGSVDWSRVGKGAAIGGAVGVTLGAGASLVAGTAMSGASLTLTTQQMMAGFNALVRSGLAATRWGMSKDGVNQGVKHFFDMFVNFPDRIPSTAKNLGLKPEAFSMTKEGFTNFTNAAMTLVNNYQQLGGMMRQLSASKFVYYYNNVIVVMYNGKLQSMMAGGLKYFKNMK